MIWTPEMPRERRPRKNLRVMPRVVAWTIAVVMAAAGSAHGITQYSGAAVSSNGTTNGWGVTDAYYSGMYHVAYVSTTLTSPNGRTASSGWRNASNWVRADVYLGWDATDLGSYLARSTHKFYCYAILRMSYLPNSSGSVLVRLTKWAALRYDDTTNDICGYKIRTRTYQGLDEYGWIPKNEYWKLNEAFTSKHESCGVVNIDGDNLVNGQPNVGFPEDTISIGCSNPTTCVFETNQTFSVAPAQGIPLIQVPGKNCVGLSDTQCLQQSQHTGWHVRGTATEITVTDN